MVVHHEAKQSDHAVATGKTVESGAGSTTLGTTAAEAQEKSGSLVLHVCKRSQQQKNITGGFSMVEFSTSEVRLVLSLRVRFLKEMIRESMSFILVGRYIGFD